uniref:Uncharacterized protein n=1 Tax=Rhizophora mucronata TaxID=61149 RepID=A0A2P2N4F8_RHIMU
MWLSQLPSPMLLHGPYDCHGYQCQTMTMRWTKKRNDQRRNWKWKGNLRTLLNQNLK